MDIEPLKQLWGCREHPSTVFFSSVSWVIHGSVQAMVSSTPCRTSSFCIGYCDVERNKDATCQALSIGLRGGSDIHIEQGSVKQDAQILLQPTWQVEVKFHSHIWYAETVIVETWQHEVSLSFFLKWMHTILWSSMVGLAVLYGTVTSIRNLKLDPPLGISITFSIVAGECWLMAFNMLYHKLI